jgi:hypothetical protein
MRVGAPLDLVACHDGSAQSTGVPPSWMSSDSSEEYAAEMVQAPATAAAVPFVNDGTFMQQFAQASNGASGLIQPGSISQQLPCLDSGITTTDSYVSANIVADTLTVAPDLGKVAADSKPKKSLLASFSTKKKEVYPILISI